MWLWILLLILVGIVFALGFVVKRPSTWPSPCSSSGSSCADEPQARLTAPCPNDLGGPIMNNRRRQ